jgi:hypothetical protein
MFLRVIKLFINIFSFFVEETLAAGYEELMTGK